MSQAYRPIALTKADKATVHAIKALAEGKASGEQQRLAWTFIVERIGAFSDLSYRPGLDGRRDTDFHEGRRFVAAQMLKIATLPHNLLIEEDKDG
ncbi:MAG: hypothetical protein AAFR47_02225 [Pseudomonadota bacterium]